MNSDGSNPQAITNGPGENTEPKWSPDGKWVAYPCSQAGETRICVVSTEGLRAGEPISGTMPACSPPFKTHLQVIQNLPYGSTVTPANSVGCPF